MYGSNYLIRSIRNFYSNIYIYRYDSILLLCCVAITDAFKILKTNICTNRQQIYGVLCDCYNDVRPLNCFLTWRSPSILWHCHLWRRARPAQWRDHGGRARGHRPLCPGWTGPAGMVCLHGEWEKAKVYNDNSEILKALHVLKRYLVKSLTSSSTMYT